MISRREDLTFTGNFGWSSSILRAGKSQGHGEGWSASGGPRGIKKMCYVAQNVKFVQQVSHTVICLLSTWWTVLCYFQGGDSCRRLQRSTVQASVYSKPASGLSIISLHMWTLSERSKWNGEEEVPLTKHIWWTHRTNMFDLKLRCRTFGYDLVHKYCWWATNTSAWTYL